MTTRFSHLTIILEGEIREDDAESLLTAIRQLRGVASVVPHETDNIAEIRALISVRNKVYTALNDIFKF